MPIQKLETNNVLKEWLDTINAMIDNNVEVEASVANKVDKVTGKGLSTEDFTTALKTKLEEGTFESIEASSITVPIDDDESVTITEDGANFIYRGGGYDFPQSTIIDGKGITIKFDVNPNDVTTIDSFGVDTTGNITASGLVISDGDGGTAFSVGETIHIGDGYSIVSNDELTIDADVHVTGDLTVDGVINAAISGNAETATKLATAGKIVLAGDASGTVSFDGSDTVLEVTVLDDSHNHTIANIDNLETTLNAKANIASPTFTGKPQAPTAATSTNSKQIATTAFVHSVIAEKIAASDAMIFKGTIGDGGTVTALPDEHSTGWTYKVITAGTYAGVKCNVGDMIVCLIDGTAPADSDWTVIEGNIDGAVTGPTSSVDANVVIFDGVSGKVVKDSGFTIAKSVPADAKFTDTTYTASNGITLDGTNFTNSGVRDISSGLTDGVITVDVNGAIKDISVGGLKSAAFTESSEYAPISHVTATANNESLGHVKLSNAVDSTSGETEFVAATPKAVKTAYDLANAALPKTGGTITGDLTVEGTITANIEGNADSATEAEKLSTARTIAFAGDVSGSVSFDGSKDISVEIAVADDSHNHTIANVDNLETTLNTKANIASPTFTGTPKAPTAADGTNTTQIATTAFVTSAVSKAVDGVVISPETAVVGNIAVFNDTKGDSIKDSGFSIAKSVPADAKFTDTTYTVGTTSYSGTTKLYTGTGSNTDGTITQKAITDTFLTNQDFEDYKNSEEVVEASDVSWNTASVIAKDSIVTIPDDVLYPYGMNAIIVSVDGVVLSKGTHYEEVGTTVGDFSSKIKFLFDIEADSTINVWVSPQAKVYGSWEYIQNSIETTYTNVELCRQYADSLNASLLAPLASPILTGTPKAPTAADGTNTTQIATTEFVNNTINNVLSKGVFGSVIPLSGSTIDVSLGSCFTKTITGTTSFDITGCPAGKSAIFTLVLTNGGSKTVTWASSVKWADDEVPELTASGTDILTFITVDGGTTWYGTPSVINAL